jgi:hypothetical protein
MNESPLSSDLECPHCAAQFSVAQVSDYESKRAGRQSRLRPVNLPPPGDCFVVEHIVDAAGDRLLKGSEGADLGSKGTN